MKKIGILVVLFLTVKLYSDDKYAMYLNLAC